MRDDGVVGVVEVEEESSSASAADRRSVVED